jgi:hypothetical protein
METSNFNKETLAFNKNAIKTSIDALSTITGQAEVATDALLGAIPSVPEEGKKAVSIYFKESQKGLANLKTHVEKSLELDWTAKNAPLKNLEAIENFYKDAFSQADEIKKETKALFEKATKQLPKEAKSIVDFWSESVNNGFEFYQSYVTKNFEFAKKNLTDVSVITPASVLKSAEAFVQEGTKRAEAFVNDETKKTKAETSK